MSTEITQETHPDWYYDPKVMNTLILGSYPPHEKKRHYSFYYPNSTNHFWKLLAEIAGEPLLFFKNNDEKAVKERHALMEKLRVGVQNLGLEISRKGEGAKDTDIKITKFQDILGIIHNHPELNHIVLPGFSAKDSTYRGFLRYLKENKIEHNAAERGFAGMKFNITIGERIINCTVLNSTSRAAGAIVTYEDLVAQFKNTIAY